MIWWNPIPTVFYLRGSLLWWKHLINMQIELLTLQIVLNEPWLKFVFIISKLCTVLQVFGAWMRERGRQWNETSHLPVSAQGQYSTFKLVNTHACTHSSRYDRSDTPSQREGLVAGRWRVKDQSDLHRGPERVETVNSGCFLHDCVRVWMCVRVNCKSMPFPLYIFHDDLSSFRWLQRPQITVSMLTKYICPVWKFKL